MLKNLLSVLLLSAVIFSFTFGTSSVLAGYLYEDFDNTSFPPAGWTVLNTTGHDVSRTTYCSGYGSGTSSAICDFYDYSTGYFDLITKTFPASVAGDSLIFDHAYATAVGGYNDVLNVYTSTNGGSTWVLLITLTATAGLL